MAATVQPSAGSTALAAVWACVLSRARQSVQQAQAQQLWRHHSRACARLVHSLLAEAHQVQSRLASKLRQNMSAQRGQHCASSHVGMCAVQSWAASAASTGAEAVGPPQQSLCTAGALSAGGSPSDTFILETHTPGDALAAGLACILFRAGQPAQQAQAQQLWRHHSGACARLVHSLLAEAHQVGPFQSPKGSHPSRH